MESRTAWDAKQEGFKTGGRQERRVQDIGGMRNRKDAGKEGYRNGGEGCQLYTVFSNIKSSIIVHCCNVHVICINVMFTYLVTMY